MKTGEGNKRGISITRRKAANLLYFLIKDHPFIDGCKRIAASIFFGISREKFGYESIEDVDNFEFV